MAGKVRTNLGEIGSTLSRELTKAAAHNKRVVAQHLQNLPYDAERAAVAFYPSTGLRRVSGQLAGAIEGFSRSEAGAVTVGLRNRMAYAAVHEFGHEPYTITPKNGGLLTFMGRNGHLVSVKSVNHPGQKPRKFLRMPLLSEGTKMLNAIKREVGFD